MLAKNSPKVLSILLLFVLVLVACAPGTEAPEATTTPTVDQLFDASHTTNPAPTPSTIEFGEGWMKYEVDPGVAVEFNVGEQSDLLGTNQCIAIQQEAGQTPKIYIFTTETNPIFTNFAMETTHFDKNCPVGSIDEVRATGEEINQKYFSGNADMILITYQENYDSYFECNGKWICNPPVIPNVMVKPRGGSDGLDDAMSDYVSTNEAVKALASGSPGVYLSTCFADEAHTIIHEQYVMVVAPGTGMEIPCNTPYVSIDGYRYAPQENYNHIGLKIAMAHKGLVRGDSTDNATRVLYITSYPDLVGFRYLP